MAFLRLECNFAKDLKILAVILSFLVLQLSVKPCCLDSGMDTKIESKVEMEDQCCSNGTSSDSEDLPVKTCSPFFSCCAGAGFVFKKSQTFNTGLISFLKEIAIPKYKDLYKFELGVSVFQPPQIIS